MSSPPVCNTNEFNSSTQKRSFKKDLRFELTSPVDRQRQLLFSEYRSDVIFCVGNVGELIHAHKLILTIASELFYTQLSMLPDDIDNGRNIVKIVDVEPAAFREVLRYIYCERALLTDVNVISIYYASQKYGLTGLQNACRSYFQDSVKEANVLRIFDDNRQYGFADVDQVCLKIIQDNPLMCFNSDGFLKLSEATLKLITVNECLNCQKDQLSEAVDKWRKANNSEAKFELKLRVMKCRKLHFFSKFNHCSNIVTNLEFSVCNRIHLYGVGIFVGEKRSPQSTYVNNLKGSVKIILNIKRHNVSITRTVIIEKDLFVYEIVFQKLTFAANTLCDIEVKLDGVNTPGSEFFCLNGFKPVNNQNELPITIVERKQYQTQSYNYSAFQNYPTCNNNAQQNNLVAYLLYNLD